MAKTTGIVDLLRIALQPFVKKKSVVLAFIYGSAARARQGPKSDIDLLIIGNISLSDLIPTLRKTQEQLGREINPTIYKRHEFRTRVREKAHFIRAVLARPKLMVVGNPDDLDRLAG